MYLGSSSFGQEITNYIILGTPGVLRTPLTGTPSAYLLYNCKDATRSESETMIWNRICNCETLDV